ncbi:NADH-ubiquinone oxidoreductase B18 subunit-domain-containing protein [Lipomyces oligophaga]|uniref:NADH-ubiquinone oxidoreductase B18 subunit-domain-containing protein n=1 Tax=Lipomyces oligophaga TaxID=45792 RepID=UPI0034CDF99C
MVHETPETYEWPRVATAEEMKAAEVPLHLRDRCASLLIPLIKCRRENAFMPWGCTQEKHGYEKCAYMEYQSRVLARERQKAEEKAAAIAIAAAAAATESA